MTAVETEKMPMFMDIEVEVTETTTPFDTAVLAYVTTMTTMVTDNKREEAATNAHTRMMATPELESL